MAAAAEGLGRLLGADRVGFFRVEGDTLTRTMCWSGGALPPLAGPIPAATLGSTLLARCRAGQPTAIADVHRFDWTSEAVPGLEGVGAIVAAPVHRVGGEWYAGVYVHDAERREWQEREIALISEIAYQAWEGIERMRAQSELRLALDASAAGTWSVDLDTRAVSWDERSAALFGFTPGVPVTFEAMASRMHDEDRVHVTARLEDVRMNVGLDEWDMEFRVVRPDGSPAWIHGIGRSERDAEGRATRLSGINLDVTARKQAEAALREVRDQQREHAETMRRLLEGASQGILSIDPAGTIVTANAAVEAMFAWAPGSLVGQTDRRAAARLRYGRGTSGTRRNISRGRARGRWGRAGRSSASAGTAVYSPSRSPSTTSRPPLATGPSPSSPTSPNGSGPASASATASSASAWPWTRRRQGPGAGTSTRTW